MCYLHNVRVSPDFCSFSHDDVMLIVEMFLYFHQDVVYVPSRNGRTSLLPLLGLPANTSGDIGFLASQGTGENETVFFILLNDHGDFLIILSDFYLE